MKNLEAEWEEEERSFTVVPHRPLTFRTNSLLEWAGTAVDLKTLPSVTNPCLTVITDGTHHAQASGEYRTVFDDTVTCLQHAFYFPTMTTHRKPVM